MNEAYVIVGASLAGAKAAEALREEGFGGPVVLIGEESERPWLGGGRVLAGMNVNVWDVNETIQAMVRGGRTVDPARLADPDVPLEEFLAG